jgi:CRP-like cAMP-binding protein
MNPSELQEIRSTPLFARLTDEQLDCLDGGQIVEAPVGSALATEGERTGLFHVLLEGEVRASRTYDRQSILLGVNRPGSFMGETMLLLDIPWVATLRVSKPVRSFQLDEERFWRSPSRFCSFP